MNKWWDRIVMSPDEPAAGVSGDSPAPEPAGGNDAGPTASPTPDAFAGLSSMFDEGPDDAAPLAGGDDVQHAGPVADAGSAVQPTPPAPPPAQATPAPVATPPPPAAAAPVPDQSQAPGQAVPLDHTDPVQVLATLDGAREAYERYLGELHCKIDPAELETLATDPAAFFQTVGGRLLFIAQRAALATVANMVPAMMNRGIEQRETQQAASKRGETFFRTMWPQIGPEHDEAVVNAARFHKSAYPQATKEERALAVGRMVTAQLGLSTAPARAGQPQQRQAGGQKPFVPATPGASLMGRSQEAHNPFAGLGLEFDE